MSAGVGRNEPCPCGSGKKYKRCCLRAETARPYTAGERSEVRAKLGAFTTGPRWEAVRGEALTAFWGPLLERAGQALDEQALAQSEHSFLSWFWFDYRLEDGTRVVDRFLERGRDLSTGERRYLEQMRGSSQHLYEIAEVVPGASLTLLDLGDRGRITVQERMGSRSLDRRDLIAARLALPGGASGKPEIDDLTPLPAYGREALVSELEGERSQWKRDHPRSDSSVFYELYAPRLQQAWLLALLDPPVPKVVLPGGEEILITRVRFEVVEGAREAVVSALDDAGDMVRDDGERTAWSWHRRKSSGPPPALALEGNELVVEAVTRQAAEKTVRRLERLLKGKIRKGLTSHETLAESMRRMRERPPPPPPAEEIPGADEAVREYYARHYRAWLDEPVPALEGATPRDAARSEALRPALIGLLKDLELTYARSLSRGEPAYDPFWMWEELGLELEETPASPSERRGPPPLGHENMTRLVPGLADAARALAGRVRRRPDFDTDSLLVDEDLEDDLPARRFLLEHAKKALAFGLTEAEAAESGNLLGAHLLYLANYELHHRKTFWIEEGLAWMLARTGLDIQVEALKLPFASFALVFTDRDTLAVAERLLSKEETCTHRGRILKTLTVYAVGSARRETAGSRSSLSLNFLFDDLSEDWPYLVRRDLALHPGAHLDSILESHLDDVDPAERDPLFASPDLRELVERSLNAVLYATSAGVETELRRAAPTRDRRVPTEGISPAFSSEEVFFLPGHIDIRKLRQMRAVERAPGGRRLVHRFLVRGHWRRANPSWKDQGNRWIEPHWRGPRMAPLIERAYRLRTPASGAASNDTTTGSRSRP